MQTRRAALRTPRDGDHGFLYELMTPPGHGARVRFGGATPSPGKVADSLWDSVLAQFVIESVSRPEPLGVVAVTSANFRDRTAYLSAIGSDRAVRAGILVEGVFLGLNYAFRTWPFRKLYLEASEDSFQHISSGLGEWFEEEGRLRDHQFWDGSYRDKLILALYRETWAEKARETLERLDAGRRT